MIFSSVWRILYGALIALQDKARYNDPVPLGEFDPRGAGCIARIRREKDEGSIQKRNEEPI